MKYLATIASAMALACIGSAASAAVITKSYEVTSTFFPIMSGDSKWAAVTSFDVTFDLSASGAATAPVITNYVTTGGASFANPMASYTFTPFNYNFVPYPGGMMHIYTPETRTLVLYGGASGSSIFRDTDDFEIELKLDPTGSILNVSSKAATSPGNVRTAATTASIVTTSVAAVPEPGTWAMMLVGFGLVGATARYRRRTTLRLA